MIYLNCILYSIIILSYHCMRRWIPSCVFN